MMRDRYRTEADRLDTTRSTLANLHGGYRKSESAVTVTSVTPTASGATVRLNEATSLFFTRSGPGSPDRTSYWVDHELVFARQGSGWALADTTCLVSHPISLPVTQFADQVPGVRDFTSSNQPAAAGKPKPRRSTAAGPRPGPGSRTKQPIAAGYDYLAMVLYARAWAHGRNSDYPSYDDDCTGFISQAMRAGGWATVGSWPADDRADNSKWFFGSFTWTTSYTWGGAENWYWFAEDYSKRTYILAYLWDLVWSDVLQYDFGHDNIIDHTQICTGNSLETGEPLMTQHDDDYTDKPLSEILQNPHNANAWFYAHRT
jgi:Putative amidase domain